MEKETQDPKLEIAMERFGQWIAEMMGASDRVQSFSGLWVTGDQISKAARQVGLTREQKVQWAIRLANTDLESLTDPEWINLSLQLSTFAMPLERIEVVQSKETIPVQNHQSDEQVPVDGIAFPVKDEIRLIHEDFNRLLGVCDPRDNEMKLEGRLLKGRATLFFSRWGDGHCSMEFYAFDHTDKCAIALMRLLEEYGDRVRTCPTDQDGCGKRFLARRADQKYCSSTCVNRSTTRRLRARRKAKEGRKHAKR